MLRRSLPAPLRVLAGRRDLPLSLVREKEALAPAADLAALGAAPAPGAGLTVTPPVFVEPGATHPALVGRGGGAHAPEWAVSGQAPMAYDTTLFAVVEVLHMPRFGALIDASGRVFADSVEELAPDIDALPRIPGVRATRGGPVLSAPRDAPRIERAGVWMAEGGVHNWGHLLLDGLTGLVALEQAGLLGDHPPVAPRLVPWARQALALAFPGLAVAERPEPVLKLGRAVYTNCMAHFLHAPNPLVAEVGRRMKAAVPVGPAGPERVYLSRRGARARTLLNEAELEAALTARGFAVVAPEALPVAAQVALLRGARLVVGPTGAALAGLMFCEPGARAFELQPVDFTGGWVRALCLQVGVDWFGWFHPGGRTDAPIQPRPGLRTTSRLDLPDFLRWLDERL